MKFFTDRAAGAFAAAVLGTALLAAPALAAAVLGTALLAAPVLAAPADTGGREMLAQAAAPSPPTAATPAPRRVRGPNAQTVDQVIARLHRELEIAPDQEPEWNAVAQVMRDNAKTLTDLAQQREKDAPAMTAVDGLKSYEQIADAHTDGLRKLVPAFQALYDKMPDTQKKIADAVFARQAARTPPTPG